MSLKQIALNASIKQLKDEGFELEFFQQHLVARSIPYVRHDRTIDSGAIVCLCQNFAGPDKPSGDHTVWFIGEMPCKSDGTPMDAALFLESTKQQLENGLIIDRKFSNKKMEDPEFPRTYHDKIVHYVTLIQNQAKVIDPNVDARTGVPFKVNDETSPFKYQDSSSSRAGIYALSQKLAKKRIAIVGLGGTGGYILDQVAKTHVGEIHLFDDDEFSTHNAFRAPGAPSFEALNTKPLKVDYHKALHEPMRNGIHARPYRLTAENVNELAGFDFVFVSVDNGESRRLLSSYLIDAKIPFIDVGMGIIKQEDPLILHGTCRTTFFSPEKSGHTKLLPCENDVGGNLYRRNIQVADLNAMNALMAVIRWKQYCGFYGDDEMAHNLDYTIGNSSIARRIGPEET